jgi:hypothetical protein
MQHPISNSREEDVAYEIQNKNSLYRGAKGIDVGIDGRKEVRFSRITTLGHSKDSLWSIDLLCARSFTLRAHRNGPGILDSAITAFQCVTQPF